jgi:hypothetical protein
MPVLYVNFAAGVCGLELVGDIYKFAGYDAFL